MFEVKEFKENYIEPAAKLFTVSFEKERSRIPLILDRDKVIDEVSDILRKISGRPGVVAFRGVKLVGYMLETNTAENFMSKRTAFCIDLCAHCAAEKQKELIYQRMYERLSRIWVGNQYLTHEISFFASDDVISFTSYRLGFLTMNISKRR